MTLMLIVLTIVCPNGTQVMFEQSWRMDDKCVAEEVERYNDQQRNLMMDSLDYTKCRREKTYTPYCQEITP